MRRNRPKTQRGFPGRVTLANPRRTFPKSPVLWILRFHGQHRPQEGSEFALPGCQMGKRITAAYCKMLFGRIGIPTATRTANQGESNVQINRDRDRAMHRRHVQYPTSRTDLRVFPTMTDRTASHCPSAGTYSEHPRQQRHPDPGQ